MKVHYWICSVLMILGIGCKTTVDTPIGYTDNQITFGNGGGITGAVTSYTLLANGQIFKSIEMATDQWKKYSTIDKKAAKLLIKECTELKISTIDHNHPGNIYKFINPRIDQKENYISWGSSDHPIDEEISAFYFQLIELIKQ